MYVKKEHPITREDQRIIVRLKDAGMTFEHIGRILGYSGNSIARRYRMEKEGKENKSLAAQASIDWSKVYTGIMSVKDISERIAARAETGGDNNTAETEL